VKAIWSSVFGRLRADLAAVRGWFSRQQRGIRITLWVIIIAFAWVLVLTVLLLWAIWLLLSEYVASRSPDSPQTRQRQLRRAQRDLHAQIAELERTRSHLSDPRGQFILEYRGIRLWEFWVSTPTGEGPVAHARATCDTASNMVVSQRATLTRMATGGLLLGPLGAILSLGFQKKQVEDHRELYVLVEAPTFAGLIQCPPDEGAKARKVAMAINLAASTSIESQQIRPEQLAQVESDLARVRALAVEVQSSAVRSLEPSEQRDEQ
jgi:hypothetical protein